MSDPVAEAAAQLAAQQSEPSLITEIKEGMHELAEKVEHLIHPESTEGPNAADTLPAGGATDAGTGEHPHTTILRRLTATLRRKFNVFDGELEAILKDAESHL